MEVCVSIWWEHKQKNGGNISCNVFNIERRLKRATSLCWLLIPGSYPTRRAAPVNGIVLLYNTYQFEMRNKMEGIPTMFNVEWCLKGATMMVAFLALFWRGELPVNGIVFLYSLSLWSRWCLVVCARRCKQENFVGIILTLCGKRLLLRFTTRTGHTNIHVLLWYARNKMWVASRGTRQWLGCLGRQGRKEISRKLCGNKGKEQRDRFILWKRVCVA